MLKRLLLILMVLLCSSLTLADTRVLEFSASWCGPCQQMAPVVDQLIQEGYPITKVDIDRQSELAQKYQIKAVPTIIVEQDGQVVRRQEGLLSRSAILELLRARPRAMAPRGSAQYATPTGVQLATVRIYCQERGGTSKGSGVLTRWNEQTIVLTAHHVIADATSICVGFLNRTQSPATILGVDRVWDCAALAVNVPQDITPAELETSSVPNQGDTFWACGFGPDERFAVVAGRFVNYTKPTGGRDLPSDWVEMSGSARQGDSGGPVFNQAGRIAGILWGTDGRGTMFAQSGRVQTFLKTQCGPNGCPSPGRQIQMAPRPNPTMPSAQAPSVESVQAVASEAARQYLMPFRQEIAGQQEATNRRLDSIQQQLSNLGERMAQPAPQAPPIPEATPEPKPEAEGPRTLPGKAAEKAGEWLEEHGGPISSRIAEKGTENLQSDSPRVRFEGWAQVHVAILIFGLAVLVILFLGVRAIHKINDKALPKLAERAAATPNTLDDKAVGLLQALHNRIDGVETKIDQKVPILGKVEDHIASLAQHAKQAVATTATVASVAAPQIAPLAAAAQLAANVPIPQATPPQGVQ